MKELPNILESTKKIRFQDCDPFNHLNNGRKIKIEAGSLLFSNWLKSYE